MKASPKKIIFFAETVTLAHAARSIAIADQLRKQGRYTIFLAMDKRYDKVIGNIEYYRIPLRSTIDSELFFERINKGLPIYSEETLVRYVEEDLEIIDAYKPDFIFGDFRLSLAISSKLSNIPYATITNAYWSAYANIRYLIPGIALTKIVGVYFAQILFDLFRPVVFGAHALSFNRACKKFGVPPLRYDMRDIYTHADFVLYADIEALFSMRPLPENHMFIGPVLWSTKVALPEWWHALPKTKPVIFLSMGSSGDMSVLPMIIDTLSSLDVTVICVTAQKIRIERHYTNIYMTDFLSAQSAVKKADIVICNGGSPMVYQSLVENKAIIGIPSNLDQYLMMAVLKNANKGQLIRADQANPTLIAEAVSKALVQKNIAFKKEPKLTIDRIIALIDRI